MLIIVLDGCSLVLGEAVVTSRQSPVHLVWFVYLEELDQALWIFELVILPILGVSPFS
jgi:hypothetical protein